MAIKERLIELFESDSKFVQYGYSALADILGCKPSSINVTLSKLPEYRKMRPNIVPAQYRGDTPFVYQGNTKTTGVTIPFKDKQPSAAKEKIVDCKLGKVPVYSDDTDLVETHLLNGLTSQHLNNIHLLDKFDKVYTFYADNSFVVTDKEYNHFASNRLSFQKKYRSYLRKKEK